MLNWTEEGQPYNLILFPSRTTFFEVRKPYLAHKEPIKVQKPYLEHKEPIEVQKPYLAPQHLYF